MNIFREKVRKHAFGQEKIKIQEKKRKKRKYAIDKEKNKFKYLTFLSFINSHFRMKGGGVAPNYQYTQITFYNGLQTRRS